MKKDKVTACITPACSERLGKIFDRYGMTVPGGLAQVAEALSWIRPECYFAILGEIQRPEFLAARPGRPSRQSSLDNEQHQGGS